MDTIRIFCTTAGFVLLLFESYNGLMVSTEDFTGKASAKQIHQVQTGQDPR